MSDPEAYREALALAAADNARLQAELELERAAAIEALRSRDALAQENAQVKAVSTAALEEVKALAAELETLRQVAVPGSEILAELRTARQKVVVLEKTVRDWQAENVKKRELRYHSDAPEWRNYERAVAELDLLREKHEV